MPLTVTDTFQKLKPLILGLIEALDVGGNVTGYGVSPRVAIWSGPHKITSVAGLTTDIASSMYVVADGGGIRNASDSAGLLFNTNGSIQADADGNARGVNAVDFQLARVDVALVASGDGAFGCGESNEVSGDYAFSSGYYNVIDGNYAHGEGSENTASGNYAHVEGNLCSAGGAAAHAEGGNCIASGARAHAEGGLTQAPGDYAHSQGYQSIAEGDYSSAGGRRAKTGANDGVFIWADSVNADFDGVAANEFSYRAQGGMRHAYDNANYMSRAVASNGNTTFDIVAGSGTPAFTFAKDINAPSLVLSATLTLPNAGLHLLDTDASHDLILAPGSDLTADRTLTLTTGDADRTVTLSGNPTLDDWFDQSVKQASSPTFAGLTISAFGAGFVRSNGAGVLSSSALIAGDLPAHASLHEAGGGDDIDHDLLSGFVANEHIDHTAVILTAGNGLTGGGDISANRSFALTMPGTITAATPNSAAGNHTHAVTTTADGETNHETILTTDSSGRLRLEHVGIGCNASTSKVVNLYGSPYALVAFDTIDTADTGRVVVAGGGDAAQTRGAYIALSGNETSGIEGDLYIVAGNSGVGGHGRVLYYAGGSLRGYIAADGDLYHSNAVYLYTSVTNPSAVTNYSAFFAKDVSSSSEAFAMDEAGNVAQLTPHNYELIDPTPGRYSWVQYHCNEFLGIEKAYNIEALFEWAEAESGQSFRTARRLPASERKNWEVEQRRRRAEAAAQGRQYQMKSRPQWMRDVTEV